MTEFSEIYTLGGFGLKVRKQLHFKIGYGQGIKGVPGMSIWSSNNNKLFLIIYSQLYVFKSGFL